MRTDSTLRRADAILTADWHLRKDQPICRLDNYQEAQNKKIVWIKELQNKHKDPLTGECPILLAGDVFDTWKPETISSGFEIATWAIRTLPNEIISIPGQHDLPYHDPNSFDKSPLAVLKEAKKMRVFTEIGEPYWKKSWKFSVTPIPWQYDLSLYCPPKHTSAIPPPRKIIMIHTLVMEPRTHNPNIKYDITTEQLLDTFKEYDLILCGDNHMPFTYRNKRNQLLVNPGSIMRMRADQIEHKPRVYLWYAKENEVELVYFPIQKDVVSRDHIEEGKEPSTKNLIKCLEGKNAKELAISFSDNINKHIRKNKVNSEISNRIFKAMEGK